MPCSHEGDGQCASRRQRQKVCKETVSALLRLDRAQPQGCGGGGCGQAHGVLLADANDGSMGLRSRTVVGALACGWWCRAARAQHSGFVGTTTFRAFFVFESNPQKRKSTASCVFVA